MFAQGNKNFISKILDYKINCNFPLWDLFSDDQLKLINSSKFTHKNVQQIMGKLEWVNRKYRLDIEILPIDLLYKYPFLSKNEFLFKIMIRNLFGILPDLKFIIEKNQFPLSKLYFFKIFSEHTNPLS